MPERLRIHLLRWLRVPPEPEAPAGAPGSLRVFRAGRNFYKLKLLRWGLGQISAAFGIFFSLVMIDRFEASATSPPSAPTAETRTTEVNRPAGKKAPKTPGIERAWSAARKATARWPRWIFSLFRLAEFAAICVYVCQIPLTFALLRLDYELRWYLVTDRSLRIRSGIASLRESTMSFANLQQVVVSQGPVQRLLGIADVRVQSAGGGAPESGGADAEASLHTGVFHGVENAGEIRDLILDRLRQFRASGLGDPDETTPHDLTPVSSPPPADSALAAARLLLDEIRTLRRLLD